MQPPRQPKAIQTAKLCLHYVYKEEITYEFEPPRGDRLLTLQKLMPSILALMAMLVSAPSAYAFKAAFVQSDSAVMRQSASDAAPSVGTLPKGTRVNTSDNPTAGYYRARSSKASGWIKDSDLSFDMSSAPAAKAPPPAASRKRARNKPLSYTWTLSAFGGFDLWTPSDINNAVQSTSLNTGTSFGAELGYRFSRNWFWLFRIEHLAKSTSGQSAADPATSLTSPVSTSVASTPLMTGIQYHLGDAGDWSFDFGALLGLALGTSFNLDTGTEGTQTTDGMPATYSASPVTALLKFDINYHLSDSFWGFFEPGYRILKTGQLQNSATNASTTTTGFLSSYTGVVNLSGLVLNFGARLNF
jgi:hypothetical protein